MPRGNVYERRHDRANPSALVTWKLFPHEAGCVLVLTHSLAMSDVQTAAAMGFGDDPMVILARNAAGWHRLLDTLEAVIEGRSLDWPEQAQQELQKRYAAMIERP